MNFYRSLKTLGDLQTRRVAREFQFHEPEHILYPANIEPRFYAHLPNTRGARAIILEARGFMGPNITQRVVPAHPRRR